MTPEQASMLNYLHDTFPGQVVLPQVKLQRHAVGPPRHDRKRAQQRLDNQQVDFVVCNRRPPHVRLRHRAIPPEQRQGQGPPGEAQEPHPQNRWRAFRLPEERHPPHAFARRFPQATRSGRAAPAQTQARKRPQQQRQRAPAAGIEVLRVRPARSPTPASANPKSWA